MPCPYPGFPYGVANRNENRNTPARVTRREKRHDLEQERDALTRFRPDWDPGLGTLSRNAGEGLQVSELEPLSHTTGEGGPSLQAGWVRVNAGKHLFDFDRWVTPRVQ